MDNLNYQTLKERLKIDVFTAKLYSIYKAKVKKSWGFEERSIPQWHCLFVHSGSAKYWIGSKEVSLKPGRILLLSPETPYRAEHGEDQQLYFFPFRFELTWPEKSSHLIGWARNREAMLELCHKCWEFYHLEKSTALANSALSQLLWEMLKSFEENIHGKSSIESLMAEMEESPVSRQSIQDMCVKTGLSSKSLQRQFYAQTGLSPKAYQLKMRINHALTLLDQTQWSIAKVAEACSYDDPYLFSKQFKQHTGVSPKSYRTKSYLIHEFETHDH